MTLRIEHLGPDTGRDTLTADAGVHALLVFRLFVVGVENVEVVDGGDLVRLDAQRLVQVGGENMADGHIQVDGEGGLADTEIDGILDRSRLYEAALLFKIATRRIHRLNSSRPQELSAMLGEIAACLAEEARRS